MSVGQRKGRDHLHGLAVLDFPKVLFGLTVGDDSKPEAAQALGSALSVMLVKVDADLVGSQRSAAFPHDVFHRRVRYGPNVHVHVKFASTFASFVVEVDALTGRAKQMKIEVVEIVPSQ